jgi:hypothetical protein
VGESSSPQTTVTITGSGFRGGALRVAFDDTPSESVTWLNESTLQVLVPNHPAGVLALSVTNEDGQFATLPRAVTCLPSPVVSRYYPLHAPAAGGYQITVEGYHLQSASHAEFYSAGSGSETLAVNVIDSTQVLVTVPASLTRPPGRVSLNLRTTENQYTYAEDFWLDPAAGPTFAISSITPDSGPAGTVVTVSGVGFGPTATLQMCGRLQNITSRSATQLVAAVVGDAGLGGVFVSNSDTEAVSVYPGFIRTSGTVPTLSLVAPLSGPTAGGVTVTLTGTGFQATDTVTFGGYPAQVTSHSATALVVTAPPHPPGVVNVVVMTEDLKRSAAVLPAAFTYQ